MNKYRFRKVYFQCTNKLVMDAFTEFANAYKNKEYAESNLESRTTHMMWEDEKIPLPKKTVEGFYLVHESLFDEILKQYTDQQ